MHLLHVNFPAGHLGGATIAMSVEAAATAAPASSTPAQDLRETESVREKSTQEEQNGSGSSQSLRPDQGVDILRNAPTFKDDIATERKDNDGASAAAASTAEKPKSPGIIAKIMQKLGLNDVLLKSMFKSVPPPPVSLSSCTT